MPLAVEVSQPIVYSPRSLSETFAFLLANPGCQVISGGTARGGNSRHGEAGIAVSLHQLEELKKVTEGERSLDLGSGVPLAQILGMSDTRVAPVFKDALRLIGTSALRNLATLGGNLCQTEFAGDLFPVLLLLGAQFELRGQRSVRWVQAQDLIEDGHVPLAAGELLTRIRLPLESAGQHFYQKIGSFRTPWEERLSMVCLAAIKADALERFRLVFSLPHIGLVRPRDLELELTGRRLPLGVAERERVLEHLDGILGGLKLPASVFQRGRILHLTRWVLTRLEEDN